MLKNCQKAAEELEELVKSGSSSAEELVAAAREGMAKLLDKARGAEGQSNIL